MRTTNVIAAVLAASGLTGCAVTSQMHSELSYGAASEATLAVNDKGIGVLTPAAPTGAGVGQAGARRSSRARRCGMSSAPRTSWACRRCCRRSIERVWPAAMRKRSWRTRTRASSTATRCKQSASYLASGSGRTWKCTTSGFVPLPPSLSHGVRSPLGTHRPRPFQPAFASSMRPSKPFE